MAKSSVFIASSGRALTLAEKLKDCLLANDFCEPRVWSEESKNKPSKPQFPEFTAYYSLKF